MNSEEKKTIKIRKFVVGLLYTNCYLVYDTDTSKGIIIDPGEHDPELVKYVRENNIDIEYIVNTHGHADHIRGNADFGYPVVIHKLDEPCLHDSSKNLSIFSAEKVKPVQVKKILSDGDILKLGDVEMRVIHTPGHTPGSISISYNDILFSGDTLFFEGVGRTDLPSGSQDSLMRSIKEKLFMLPDSVKVLPGHGPDTTIGHEKQHNPFL